MLLRVLFYFPFYSYFSLINDILRSISNYTYSDLDDPTLHSSTNFKFETSFASKLIFQLQLSNSIPSNLDISLLDLLNFVKLNI